MAHGSLTKAKAAPDLNIPKSEATVKLSVIDSTSRLKLKQAAFFQPEYVGHEYLAGPAFSFLIEHPHKKAVLFDLGIRYDWQRLPSFQKFRDLGWGIMVEKDVATILKDNGVNVDGGAIDAIIWSHHHWDHTGDASLFPSSTHVVVGPGFKKAHLPGYPDRKDSTILQADLEGREVREVDVAMEGRGRKIGRFFAYDYFGDGSFYLLDTPGHTVGHLCGLVRTTADSFAFLGGDACHHGGEFRPTEYLPLPSHISPSPLHWYTNACPGQLLQDIHPEKAADKPYYLVKDNFCDDRQKAEWTIAGVEEFDCQDNVLVLVAHDSSLVDPPMIDFYPKSINDWHGRGLGRKTKWLFLNDFEQAREAKDRNEPAFEWGAYP